MSTTPLGDVLFDAPIHPWSTVEEKKTTEKPGGWFRGKPGGKKAEHPSRARAASRIGAGGRASPRSMQWMLPKMVVVLLETKLGVSTLVTQAFERSGIQTVYSVSSVDEIEPMLVEAQACAKFVTLVCHADSSDDINDRVQAISELAQGEMSSSIGIICLIPGTENEAVPAPDSIGTIEAFDSGSPPWRLMDHDIVAPLEMPFTQVEMITALCCNHVIPDDSGHHSSAREIGPAVLLMCPDALRRRELHETLERALVGVNSCSLNPTEVEAWLKVCLFDCILVELPVITDVFSRRRSWWKFTEELAVEETLPGTVVLPEITGSMGVTPGAELKEHHVQVSEAIELLEIMAQAGGEVTAPVVVSTSNSTSDTLKLLTESGVSKLIPFPCPEKLLLSTVNSAANGKSPSARAAVTRKPTQTRKGTNKNANKNASKRQNAQASVTSTDGTSSRAPSMIRSNKKVTSSNRKGSQSRAAKETLTEATLRGMYGQGFTSLTAESGMACGVMRGATHHVPQDRMMILENFGAPGNTFLGIFDGHGPDGHHVSQFLIETIPSLLLEEMDQEDINLPNAIKITCQLTKEMLDVSEVDASSSGSTAVFAIVTEETIYVGNVGDSRAAILCAKAGSCCGGASLTGEPLTDDHKPESSAEAARVRAAGGLCMQMGPVMRVVQPTEGTDGSVRGLAMTRSFGDIWAENIGVIPEPDVFMYKRCDHDRYLVAASDGMWDMMTEVEVASYFVQAEKDGTELSRTTQGLVEEAVNRWTSQGMQADDTSMVVLAI